jgi:hypothetical protein
MHHEVRYNGVAAQFRGDATPRRVALMGSEAAREE